MNLTSRIAAELGWNYGKDAALSPSDAADRALLRTLILPAAAANGNPQVLAEARRRFEDFISGSTDALHPNLRGPMFAINVRYGSVKEYEAVLKLYETTVVADQKTAALSALAATMDPALIKRILELALDPTRVRS